MLQAEFDQLKEENTVIRKSLDDLKGRVSMKQEELKKDDKKVKYYTGLPTFGLLKTVYDFVASDLPSDITGSKLDPFYHDTAEASPRFRRPGFGIQV